MSETPISRAFGTWLKRRRQELGLTQQQLGQQVSCSTITIRKLEKGEFRPSRETADLLAKALKLTTDQRQKFVVLARGGRDKQGEPMSVATTSAPAGRTNLPNLLTPLIGRKRDVAEAARLLNNPQVRLLTLTGMGGVGKTRLSIAVAHALVDEFEDGAQFVDLAAVTHPEQVPDAIARVLGKQEDMNMPVPGRTSMQLILESLRDKQTLLLLDNFEQIMGAAPIVADILKACARVKVIVTSRDRLHLRSERIYRVEPLPTPQLQTASNADIAASTTNLRELARNPAVALFVDRARAAHARFELTEQNGNAVAELCSRLEGVPLAIELISGRVKLMQPQVILSELVGRQGELYTDIVADGRSDLPARQHTLHNTIAWSYRLLTSEQQEAFQCLGIFPNACDVTTAVEVVWRYQRRLAHLPDSLDALDSTQRIAIWDTLTSLIDKSLLQHRESGERSRLTMLETLRGFAREQLDALGRRAMACDCHLAAFTQFAETLASSLLGRDQLVWQTTSVVEYDNVRAAQEWALVRRDTRACYVLAIVMHRLWVWYGRFGEGYHWLRSILALPLPDTTDDSLRLRLAVLRSAGFIATLSNDLATTVLYEEEAVALARQLEDPAELAYAFDDLAATLRLMGETSRALALYRESLVVRETADDDLSVVDPALQNWAGLGYSEEDYRTARDLSEWQVLHWRKRGTQTPLSIALLFLGEVARSQRDDTAAAASYMESLEICERLGDRRHAGWCYHNMGHLALRGADGVLARQHFRQSLHAFGSINYQNGVASALAGMVGAVPDPHVAATLFGAQEALFKRIGRTLDPVDAADCEPLFARVRAQFSPSDFAIARDQGRAMTTQQAVELALVAD